MTLKKNILFFLITIFIFTFSIDRSQAQQNSLQNSLSRQVEGLIRIAEVGEVVDTVNVWGSVGLSGRYVIPRNLNIPQLLSYAGGLGTGNANRQQLEWVNNRILIRINRYLPDESLVEVTSFESDYKEALPLDLFQYDLQNEDIITVQVERRPNFWDYLGRAAPIIGIVTSTLILIDRF